MLVSVLHTPLDGQSLLLAQELPGIAPAVKPTLTGYPQLFFKFRDLVAAYEQPAMVKSTAAIAPVFIIVGNALKRVIKAEIRVELKCCKMKFGMCFTKYATSAGKGHIRHAIQVQNL